MNKTYIFLAFILIALGLGMFVLDANEKTDELPPRKLLIDLNENTHYITTDELAARIIEGDPTIQLIDVRDPYDYMDFSLPGAESLPIADICTEVATEIFETEGKDFILFSNGDVDAGKAWMLVHRIGIERLYVLRGCNKYLKIRPYTPLHLFSKFNIFIQ